MDELERAVDALSSLVRRCFGPCGEETLLFAPPEPPVVTADGHALLSSWRRGLLENRVGAMQQEPMQTYILDAMEGVFAEIGDGTTQFVLLVHGAVKHAMDAIRHSPHHSLQHQWSASDCRRLAAAFGGLKRECASLLRDFASWQPGLQIATPIEFVNGDDGSQTPSEVFCKATTDILRSGLSGLLGEQVLTFLTGLVIEWIFTPRLPVLPRVDARLLFNRVQHFLNASPSAIAFTIASSVYDSQVLPPDAFILRKSLVPSQLPSMLNVPKGASSLRFICCTCQLSLASGTNHVTIQTRSHEELFNAHDATRLFISKYLRDLRHHHDIRLLVCTEEIPDYVVEMCTRLEIACVQFAEQDDVMDLCAVVNTYPLASLFDEIDTRQHIGICDGGVSNVRLQQSAYLRFHGLQANIPHNHNQARADLGPRIVVPQLMLKAPTKAVYKQYYKAVTKALRILKSWWEPAGNPSKQQFELYSCRGGGATESALARRLQETTSSAISNEEAVPTLLARRIFADALMEVVVVLRENMSAAASSDSSDAFNRKSHKRTMLQDMVRMTRSGDQQQLNAKTERHHHRGYVLNNSHTVATMTGDICIPELVFDDPESYGLLHPWRRMDTIVYLVLQTLEQLFRVDCIVRTTKRVRMGDGETESLEG